MVSFNSLCVYWKWPSAIQRYQFVAVLAAGFLMELTLGTTHTYGNMVPYMVSYVRNQSAPANLMSSDTVYLYALQYAGIASSVMLGGTLQQYLGPRIVSLCGGWFMSLGVALTYFTIQYSFWLAMLTYGFMFGFGIGLGYVIPLTCAVKWLPKYKGMANGIVLSGIGCSAMLFNFVQTAYINPSNYSPTCNAPCNRGEEKYFTQQDLINRVPFVFLLLAFIYSVLQFVACIFLVYPSPTEQYCPVAKDNDSESKEENCQSTKQDGNTTDNAKSKSTTLDRIFLNLKLNRLFSSKSESTSDSDSANLSPLQMLAKLDFYLLCIILVSEKIPLSFIITLYKVFGQNVIDNDHFLAAAGSVSAVFNLLGRIFWGALADKTSYKLALLLQSTTMCFLLYTFYGVSILSPALYFIWLCGIFFCIGGLFSLLPTATATAFGLRYFGTNYAIIYSTGVIGVVLAAFIVGFFEHIFGWKWFFVVSGGINAVAYAAVLSKLCYHYVLYSKEK